MLLVGILMFRMVVTIVECNSISLSNVFFNELKHYNSSNFRSLHQADLSSASPDIIKAFSSVITRYFIFCEKHPEISDIEKRMLYFQLKIDMIARFFANFPNTNTDDLIAFQTELRYYLQNEETGGETDV